MNITRVRNKSFTQLGNVPFGGVVVFRDPPTAVPKQHAFCRATACLGEPYILVDYGTGSRAFLIRASNGDPVRAEFGDRVEEFDDAELTL